jgi:predicted nucleic acid-binding protein
MIVSDAGPIIIFARLSRLSLLRDVAGFLLIPDAVYDEIVVKKGGMPGAAEVAQVPWIQRTVQSLAPCRAFCMKESARRSRLPKSEPRSC